MVGYIEIIGLIAGACTTFSTLPQIIKIWKRRSSVDVSLHMFLMSGTGNLLWIIYGILLGSLSLILANAISLFLALLMILTKLRFN